MLCQVLASLNTVEKYLKTSLFHFLPLTTALYDSFIHLETVFCTRNRSCSMLRFRRKQKCLNRMKKQRITSM